MGGEAVKAETFWDLKLLMALHDPPHKPFVLTSGTGGHGRAARRLIARILGDPGRYEGYSRRVDWAASGADRPVLNQRRGSTGRVLSCDFTKRPLVTHPLMGEAALELPVPTDAQAKPHKLAAEQVEAALDALEALRRQGEAEASEAANPPPIASLGDAATPEATFWWIWRGWRDNLSMPEEGQGNPLWDLLPADSRCPDHPIWEHLRVASALAFIQVRDPARHPWLMTVSVGPVQSFIRESRTSRDLWMSSFLVSELAFAAMQPFIERYGPDSILYPDLRGNARMDAWIRRHREDALPAAVADPCTQAAVIPDSFVVLAPEGQEGPERDAPDGSHLRHLEGMAEASRRAMHDRWRELCGLVERWLEKTTRRTRSHPPGAAPWKVLWERQIAQGGPQIAWSAVKWERPRDLNEMVETAESLRRRESLPAQGPHPAGGGAAADEQSIARRRARLKPWLPVEAAAHYELAREVFGAVNLGYTQNERGFDYPIVHHVLRTHHRLRRQRRSWTGGPESGEKCTMCGKRQALSSRPDERHVDQARNEARRFWRDPQLDPDRTGAERLCAVCAVKRFLVDASSDAGDVEEAKIVEAAGLGTILFGRDWKHEMAAGKLRVPFPSTASVALQGYLAWAVASGNGVDLLGACRNLDARLPQTAFPRSLARLAHAQQHAGSAGELLKYDAQYAMPHTLDAEIRAEARRLSRATSPPGATRTRLRALEDVRGAAGRLYAAFCKAHPPPDPRVAVLALDADRLGRLVLGDPDRIGATWGDVLHPDVARQLREARPDDCLQWAIDAGWPRLLGRPRHMGPALHAFITRALAVFANTIVPWVVEREYGGRLIYAGGDDVLAIAPAQDALPLAARLQQLFSAPWVIDTEPREQPWSWRRESWRPEEQSAETLQRKAQQRFVAPMKAADEESIVWPARWVEPHCDPKTDADQGQGRRLGPPAVPGVQGRIYPMLGRHQSLSAGIAYAHYKTDLRLLIDHARYLLDDVGKRRAGRGAAALGHFSRNGEKAEFAMPWRAPSGADGRRSTGPPVGHRRILAVIDCFRRGVLPGRLPYKLRALTDLAFAEPPPRGGSGPYRGQAPSEAFLRGLLSTVLEAAPSREVRNAVIEIWMQGFLMHYADAARRPKPERAVDGLLLCRALAGSGEDR